MKALSKTISLIILIAEIVPVTHADDKRYVEIPDRPMEQVTIEGRCAMPKKSQKAQSWRLEWSRTDSGDCRWVALTSDTSHHIDGIDTPEMEIALGQTIDNIDCVIEKQLLKSGINTEGGFNSLLMEWTDGQTRIFAGDRGLQLIFEADGTTAPFGRCGIQSRSKIDIQDLIVETTPMKSAALQVPMEIDRIMETATEQSGKPTGTWEFLDRENDPAKARPGGRYKLAVIESMKPDEYLIIYIGGAQINAGKWKPGMLKGKLYGTPFGNHYKLLWYDAMMEPVEHDIHADMPDRALLSLSFPLMQTVMRFSRIK